MLGKPVVTDEDLGFSECGDDGFEDLSVCSNDDGDANVVADEPALVLGSVGVACLHWLLEWEELELVFLAEFSVDAGGRTSRVE